METPRFASAAVAAGHPAAVEAGRAVLAEGGNALEAMVAVAATIAVVYPHMNGIGGDSFWVVRAPSGETRAIEAAGFAGSLATIERYRKAGHERIPLRGAEAALTVPGTIGGWQVALDMAARLGGRLPLDMLLHHAVAAALDGHAVGRSEARYIIKEDRALFDKPHFVETFFVDGKQPAAGHIRQLPALGATLAHLAKAGLDDFYRGDVAREMAADMQRLGAPVTRDDLARYRPAERKPLVARLDGGTLYMPPPPSQGMAGQLMAGIHAALGNSNPETVDFWHGFIEAAKRANAIRDRIVTDFDRLPEDPQSVLTPEVFAREAAQIDMTRAAPWPFPKSAEGDTIWAGAIDRNGLSVSLIQSIFWEYGSGLVLPETGVLMQNRGIAFSLDPASMNALKPGRRPFHTLHAPLFAFDDGRVLSYGSMGGENQPQIAAMNFIRHVRCGMGLTEALHAPRLTFGKAHGAARATVKVESRFEEALVRGLGARGHEVEVNALPMTDSFGHAGMLLRHTDGSVSADHDPRADGGGGGI